MYHSIKEIDAPELADWLDKKSSAFRVIDVRGHGEIAAGTVPSAEAVPMHTIPARMSEFERDETLIFVCRSGARSAQVCAFLQQQGYENVYNLRGGMMGWAGSGLPATLPQAV